MTIETRTALVEHRLVEAFRFTSFQQWVSKAAGKDWPAQYVCLDAQCRVCRMGRDFQIAWDDGSFPVIVYRIEPAALDSSPPSLPSIDSAFEQTRWLVVRECPPDAPQVYRFEDEISARTFHDQAQAQWSTCWLTRVQRLGMQPELKWPSLPTAREVQGDDLIPRLRHVVSQCLSVRDVSRSDGWNHAWYENAQTIRDAIRRVALSSQEPPSPPPALDGWQGTANSIAYEIDTVVSHYEKRQVVPLNADERQMVARLKMWSKRLLDAVPDRQASDDLPLLQPENPMPEMEVGDWVSLSMSGRNLTLVGDESDRMLLNVELRHLIREVRKQDGTRWLRTPEGRTP